MSRRASNAGDVAALARTCRNLGEEIHSDTVNLATVVGMDDCSPHSGASHKRLAEYVEQVAKTDAMLDLRLNAMVKAMQQVTKQVDAKRAKINTDGAAGDEDDVEDYAALLHAHVKEAMKGAEARVPESKIYIETMKHIAARGDDDDDVVAQNETVSFICPLTNAQFIAPVKSKKCGHTYSTAAIMHHIKIGKSGAMCPVAGCSHKVAKTDLQADKEMERKLRIARHTQGDDLQPPEAEGLDDDDYETLI